MYRSSARLVAYLVLKYGIPLDRAHVIGHNVPDPGNPGRRGGSSNHSDPGPCWNWTKYMAFVRQYAGRSDEAVVDDRTRGRFSAPGWRLDAKSPQRYGPGYRLAAPSPTGAPATFRVRVPANDTYAVYGWWPADRNRNSAVPVWIASAAGPTSVTVDQRRFGRRWVHLGTFSFKKGLRSIQFSRRTSTTGVIGADAVKLEPVRTPAASELGHRRPGGRSHRVSSPRRATAASWSPVTPPEAAAPTIRAVDFADARDGPPGRPADRTGARPDAVHDPERRPGLVARRAPGSRRPRRCRAGLGRVPR